MTAFGREQALALVNRRLGSANLVNHCIATEIIMEGLARHFELPEQDVARWGIVGLLHDLDYAETADDFERHGLLAAEELAGILDEECIHAILAHTGRVPADSLMDKALRAADPTTGFIVAAALVRPDRSLGAVTVASLLKRFKEKAFARGACREQMDSCEQMGLSREGFLGLSLANMQERSAELGL